MKRRPRHFGVSRDLTACGLTAWKDRPVSVTVVLWAVTCRRCRASGYFRQAMYEASSKPTRP